MKYPNAEINRGIQDKIRKSLFHKGKRAYERLTFTRLLWKVIPPTNIHPLLQEHFKNPKNLNHMNQVSVSTLHIIFPPGAAGWDWLNKTWIALSFSSIFRLKFCLQLIFVWYFLPLLTESSYSVVGAKKNPNSAIGTIYKLVLMLLTTKKQGDSSKSYKNSVPVVLKHWLGFLCGRSRFHFP